MAISDHAPRRSTLCVAAGLAAIVAVALAAMPAMPIEAIVGITGIADFVPQAAPPLGLTARLLIAGGAGASTALFFIALMALLDHDHRVRRRRARAARYADADAPSLRRGDSHPDAPARRPLMAMSELVLDQPIAEPPGAETALGALLARLERGLSARGGQRPVPSPAALDGIDSLLKNAMASLRRVRGAA